MFHMRCFLGTVLFAVVAHACTDGTLALNGALAAHASNPPPAGAFGINLTAFDPQLLANLVQLASNFSALQNSGSGEASSGSAPPAAPSPPVVPPTTVTSVLAVAAPWVDSASIEDCSRLAWWLGAEPTLAPSAAALCDVPLVELDATYGLVAAGWSAPYDLATTTLSDVCSATCASLGKLSSEHNSSTAAACTTSCTDDASVLELVPTTARGIFPLVFTDDQLDGCAALPALVSVASSPLGMRLLDNLANGRTSLTSLTSLIESFSGGGGGGSNDALVSSLLTSGGVNAILGAAVAGGAGGGGGESAARAAFRAALTLIDPDIGAFAEALTTAPASCTGDCATVISELCTRTPLMPLCAHCNPEPHQHHPL